MGPTDYHVLILLGFCILPYLGVSDGHGRVNKFGDRTEDLARLGGELAETMLAAGHSPVARGRLDAIMETIRLPERLRFFVREERSSRLCRLCNAGAEAVFKSIREHNTTGDALIALIEELCVRANVIAPHICKGMIAGNMPIIEYIIKNKSDLDGGMACGTFIPDCTDGNPALEWRVDRDLGMKPRGGVRNTMLALDSAPRKQPYRILQITDYHWDHEYEYNGNAECGEPTCCRKGQAPPEGDWARAGYWGDYRTCDIPWETFVEFTRHVQEQLHNIDLIYFTGDIVDHGVWVTSRESNERRIRETFQFMKKAFGNAKVLPLVGNHEPHPLNIFAPDYIKEDSLSSKWLYEILADEWISRSNWLPEDTRETILRGGFYTVLVQPGFRVIALNNMYCYTLNWWVLYDPVDPSGQLAWLVDVLLAAEAAEEKVHILSHIPPGDADCVEVWSREFARIVNRFSATISAHFNGHTHVDDLVIFYDEDGRPNNVAFNGGSLTTYADVNPNYKIYLVDQTDASWHVLDAELWGFNLTEANLNPQERPDWYQMYSFKETFKVHSLHPVHLDMFIERMASDDQLIQQYYRYHMLDSDVSHSTGCDKYCAEQLICNSVRSVINHNEQCQKILNKSKIMTPYSCIFLPNLFHGQENFTRI